MRDRGFNRPVKLSPTMVARMRREILGLVAPIWLAASPALAQPVRTWGADPDAHPQGATQTTAAPVTASAPPEPPPITIGTPLAGSTGASRGPVGASPAPQASAPRPPFGGKYTLEGIEVRGNTTTLARVVLRYVPLRVGDLFDVEDREIERTRFRLLSTGFFRDVQLSLRRGTRRGYVVLVVSVAERSTIVIDGLWLGLSAYVGPSRDARPLTAYGGAQVTETNLAGSGAALGGAFAVADGQLALRARLADPQLLRTTWDARTELLYNAAVDYFGDHGARVEESDPSRKLSNVALLPYKRFGGRLSGGHDLATFSQIQFAYRLEKIDAPLGSSILSTVGATFVNDTRDEPFLPTGGHHIDAEFEASLAPFGSDYPYAKLVLNASRWFALPWGHVAHIEGFAGAVFGEAPLFESFYVGDLSDLLPDRVLDLNFDRRPALNLLGTSVVESRYGSYAAKANAEYRVPLYRGIRSIYGVDVFGSFGLYALATDAHFLGRLPGYTGLASIPVDLTFNAGLRIDTQAGGFVFGVSNIVGLALKQGMGRP